MRQDLRITVAAYRRTVDADLGDFVVPRDVIHAPMEDFSDDRAQATGVGIACHGKNGHGGTSVLGELNSTSSISNSRAYCLVRALRGSVRMDTNAYLSRLLTAAITGRRPMNSGIKPNLSKSSGSTWVYTSYCDVDGTNTVDDIV